MAPRQRSKGKRCCTPGPPTGVALLPDLLHQVLLHLPQKQRVHVSEVCKAWRHATLSAALWTHLKVVLPCDDDEATAESFLKWLEPRAAAVDSLHIDIQETVTPVTEFVTNVWSNVVAALMAVKSTLRHLTIETAGCLVISQWACFLHQLTAACFIGGDVHVKQGLGLLTKLTDLEFGSNNAELEIESASCLPTCVTHLSLEHCSLSQVPHCITRLSQLRSLDLSQNTFAEDEGDECATLAELTGLECLKLANCRMTQVPTELSALRRLRILHMGGNLEEEVAVEDIEAIEAALRPLRNLQVLVISQCNILLPEAVRKMSKMERLFVTSTPVTELQPGPYCKSIRHLCVDWDVAFESIPMLRQCTELQMLTLARPHRSDVPDGQVEERTSELAAVLQQHPSLQQLNVVAVAGRGLHMSIHTLQFVLALSQTPRLQVKLISSWDSELVRIPNLVDFE